jgi:lysophospholipase L1-like esterase
MKKLFIIGDSISCHYGVFLEEYLAEHYKCFFKGKLKDAFKNLDVPRGANGGDSNMVLQYLTDVLNIENFKCDLILLNCGLHDIKFDEKKNQYQISLEDYESNLKKIIELIKSHGIDVVWVRTTKVIDEIHNSPENKKLNKIIRRNSDVLNYNKVADSIMYKNNIKSIDLYTFTEKFGVEAYCDHVHFYPHVRKLQAEFIAGYIYKTYFPQEKVKLI